MWEDARNMDGVGNTRSDVCITIIDNPGRFDPYIWRAVLTKMIATERMR